MKIVRLTLAIHDIEDYCNLLKILDNLKQHNDYELDFIYDVDSYEPKEDTSKDLPSTNDDVKLKGKEKS